MDIIVFLGFLAILVFGIPKLLGEVESIFPYPSQTDKQDKDTTSKDYENISNDESKIEAVKRQVQNNLPVAASEQSPTDSVNNETSPKQDVIKVNIDPNEIKSQTASELVDVPKGVIIKVKRARTVEHTVNIEWSSALIGKGELGIKQLVSASIQGEIQRIKGYAIKETESMEYEITLDGEKHPQYKLVWMDVWLKGVAEIQDGVNIYQQAFQFRDRAELKVIPILG